MNVLRSFLILSKVFESHVFFRIVVTDIPSRCLSVHNFENKNASQLFHSFFRIASPRLPADLLETYSLNIIIWR